MASLINMTLPMCLSFRDSLKGREGEDGKLSGGGGVIISLAALGVRIKVGLSCLPNLGTPLSLEIVHK